MTNGGAAEVAIINGPAWAARPAHIAQLLGTASHGAVIADPGGQPPDPERMATVIDPRFWAGQPEALAEALGTTRTQQATAPGRAPAGQAAGAAATANPGRLTLTVEEAAGLLGISRAFAYEAVRRGEIPSIRIGRRVLVPRVALDRLVGGEPTSGGAAE